MNGFLVQTSSGSIVIALREAEMQAKGYVLVPS